MSASRILARAPAAHSKRQNQPAVATEPRRSLISYSCFLVVALRHTLDVRLREPAFRYAVFSDAASSRANDGWPTTTPVLTRTEGNPADFADLEHLVAFALRTWPEIRDPTLILVAAPCTPIGSPRFVTHPKPAKQDRRMGYLWRSCSASICQGGVHELNCQAEKTSQMSSVSTSPLSALWRISSSVPTASRMGLAR